jgi:hypothetical protein
VSGDKAFQTTSEAAAMKAKFEVPKIEQEIVKITGTISYSFGQNRSVTAYEYLQNVRVETKPNKYSSVVKALVERLKNAATKPRPTRRNSFVTQGRPYYSAERT